MVHVDHVQWVCSVTGNGEKALREAHHGDHGNRNRCMDRLCSVDDNKSSTMIKLGDKHKAKRAARVMYLLNNFTGMEFAHELWGMCWLCGVDKLGRCCLCRAGVGSLICCGCLVCTSPLPSFELRQSYKGLDLRYILCKGKLPLPHPRHLRLSNNSSSVSGFITKSFCPVSSFLPINPCSCFR